MKFLAAILALTTAVCAAPQAAPASGSDMDAFDAAITKLFARALVADSCDECHEHLDMCMKYGIANDHQTGCAPACMKHVCLRWPNCGTCGDKFHC
ncbi:hypothetical protein BU26DRAFT_607907 [Trematosphaeria pertusa]|uniref:Uncharacterized protein n=1 Tax=Trematosphaeria pertusa TaxID=390896 RepID=A0A6A6I5A6_9PLEO|nr:uncharacterized protein BU26DRAFT_607907 [Trematosphaeria pertusa]KAF2245714.1 hypothetical protein BU26DRAFT_607907 [Trematosphaeria pertusa]